MDNSELGTAASAQATPHHEPVAPVATEPTGLAATASDGDNGGDGTEHLGDPSVSTAARKRRRGSRGGRNRKKPSADGTADFDDDFDDDDNDNDADNDNDNDDDREVQGTEAGDGPAAAPSPKPRAPRATAARRAAAPVVAEDTDESSDEADHALRADHPELPDRLSEGRPSVEAAEKALVRRPQIGDTRPAAAATGAPVSASAPPGPANGSKTRAKGGKAASGNGAAGSAGGAAPRPAASNALAGPPASKAEVSGDAAKKKRRRGGKGRSGGSGAVSGGNRNDLPLPEMDADVLERRRGRERNGRPVGRYLMCVQVRPNLTQVAVLEGRTLIEHYVSRPADDVSQIHGNIYVGKVQNVLPGMEAAFVDIGTPKNAVLYRGDTRYDPEDLDDKGANPRIEQILKARQTIICQVTKNPIGAKGARLTQEISLPGRFVVLVPNSTTYGISKRLPDNERKRLRQILDKAKPKGHGLIVRTAAEGISAEELARDVERLAKQWEQIEALAAKSQAPTLLYRDPDMSIRVIREEFNQDYRQVVIDDDQVFEQVRDYVRSISPALVERVERYDPAAHGGLAIFESLHVHEQLHKALDRKVWLPSGGSLIIERTEALTVIDVNTGKNVGTSNLEETVYRNNLEAAEEVAKQLRLRDIGGIVVIDFIDMEIRDNRKRVVDSFRSALARDKTRTQVFDISELGLVEMTRKRIGEGLLVNFADQCPNCQGRGVVIDAASLE